MAVHGSSQAPPSSIGPNIPSSSHRLPTVSATQALHNLKSSGPRSVTTGLRRLDAFLGSNSSATPAQVAGGLARGTVTEVWGPAGSGKSTLGLQAAAHVLDTDGEVIWIDATVPIVRSRLSAIASSVAGKDSLNSLSSNFHHFRTPTLAHLFALSLHPPSWFPPANTSLMVVDGLHTLLDIAYPRYSSASQYTKSETAKWASGRRYSALGTLVSALKKLAALHNIAVLVTTGCATRMRPGTGFGAVLVPGVSGMEWDNGITNRLVLFRDFPVRRAENDTNQTTKSARFVGVTKLHGNTIAEEGDVGHIIEFEILESGIKGIGDAEVGKDDLTAATALSSLPRSGVSPIKSRKRKLEVVDDSEDEISSEYGWLAEDEVAAEGMIDDRALAEDAGKEAAEEEDEG